ncbi:hypothetical protein IWX49DRAFT_587739 [Phyllosticta citricarpa]|uniref:BTB domain-containing protein n=1 Tax=Phyllosticta citricarpa TaxID=55181 RepID=A0ABR1MKG7_9PEZI
MAGEAGGPSQPSLSACQANAHGQSTEQRSPADALAEIVARRYGTPDLKITTINDQEFHVHKDVLRHRSKFFEVAIDGPFKEGVSGIISMKNDPPSAVAALLQFLYTGDYVNLYPEHYQSKWDGLFHLDVYVIAELYDIPSLIRRATYWFAKAVLQQEPSPISLLSEVIPLLYELIPDAAKERGICEFLLEYTTDRFDRLLLEEQFLDLLADHESFRVALAKHRQKAAAQIHNHIVDLQNHITTNNTWLYGCPHCRYWMTSRDLYYMEKGIYCPACKKVFRARARIVDPSGRRPGGPAM